MKNVNFSEKMLLFRKEKFYARPQATFVFGIRHSSSRESRFRIDYLNLNSNDISYSVLESSLEKYLFFLLKRRK